MPTAPEISSPASPAARRRVRVPRRYAFACVACKNRKVKCNGEQPTCRACQRSGNSCQWPTRTVESRLGEANARIQELESALRQTRSTSTDAGNDEAPQPPSFLSPASETAYTASLWSQTGVGRDGGIIFHGPTSRFHAGPVNQTDEDGEEPGVRSSSTQATASRMTVLQSQHDLIDSVWTPLIRTKPMSQFGIDNELATALLNIYWTWLHSLHNCVYRPVFIMDMALGGPLYSDFLLMCIFALAARHVNNDDSKFRTVGKGENFLAKAKELLLFEMGESRPRIPTIQGLLILGGRQCAMGKSSEGWLYSGMAIQMMTDIGLHLHTEKVAQFEKLTAAEMETRNRLYSSAFIWDKTLALSLGRPPSLTRPPRPSERMLDHFDDARDWSPVHVNDTGIPYTPVPSCNTLTFCSFCNLHEITSELILLFCHSATPQSITEHIALLSTKLERWYRDLPQQLRMDDPTSTSQSPPPHIVSLNLLYHTLHILRHRPNMRARNPSHRLHSIAICVSRSRSIHSILSLYSNTFCHRFMTYMVSYCIYTAATVDAYEMRIADGDARIEAASRLSAALRILDDEARQTPGIRRSLDTIRRQLSSWTTTVTPRSGAHTRSVSTRPDYGNGRAGIATTSNYTGPGGVGALERAQVDRISGRNSPQLQTSLGETDLNAFDQGEPADDHPFTQDSPVGFGFLNTGAGFHPNAFSWGFGDMLDRNADNEVLAGFDGNKLPGWDL